MSLKRIRASLCVEMVLLFFSLGCSYGEERLGEDPVIGTNYSGYAQDRERTPFEVNGHYTGGGADCGVGRNESCEGWLFYDGHPGYDYSTGGANLPVYATAPGKFYHTNRLNTLGETYIDHGNGYRTYYLHLLVDENLRQGGGTEVATGDQIGLVGGTRGFAVHLHLEIHYNNIPVDPYGWDGAGNDPYTRATNYDLWEPIRQVNIGPAVDLLLRD